LLKKPVISSNTKGAKELLTSYESMYEVGDIQKLSNLLEMFMIDPEIFSHSVFSNYEKSLRYDVGHFIIPFSDSINLLCQE
jgi:hypothetical protein